MPTVISLQTRAKRDLGNVGLEMPRSTHHPKEGGPGRASFGLSFYSEATYRVSLATWEDEGEMREGTDPPGSKPRSAQLCSREASIFQSRDRI